ncbi:MAG: hypothetical protein WBL85_03380 [Sedimentisphaerales bacterium]
MSTVWLKIVAVVVLLVVIFVIVSKVANQMSKPAEPERTVGDTFRHDEQRMRAEPNLAETNAPAQPTTSQPEAVQPVAQQPPAEPRKFRELTEDEKAGAEQLYELAIQQRKMAQLPGVGYGAMVQYCRQIIERYPGSEYAYKAKRTLATELPANKREFFHITPDELDLSK